MNAQLRPGVVRPLVLSLQIDAYLTRPGDRAPSWLDQAMQIMAICDKALESGGSPVTTRSRKVLNAGLAAGLAVAQAGMRWQPGTAPALDDALAQAARLHEILPTHQLSRAVIALEIQG